VSQQTNSSFFEWPAHLKGVPRLVGYIRKCKFRFLVGTVYAWVCPRLLGFDLGVPQFSD
jgi:hypothetical protein